MEVTERRGRLHLTVRGPGLAVADYDFGDSEELLAFANERERELVESGFQLQAIAERRSLDRRGRGGAPERRRRS
jgi:hypothetical protein